MGVPPSQVAAAALFEEVFAEILDLVNACAATYGEYDENKKYRPDLIESCMKRADELIVSTFLAIPGHPRRTAFITQVEVAHQGQIPTHIGPIGTVIVEDELAERWPAPEIEIIRKAQSISVVVVVKPKYDVIDTRLFYCSSGNPGTALVDIATLKPFTMGQIQSPPEFANAIIAWALAYIFGKEAAETELQGSMNFTKIAMATLEFVIKNEAVPPMAQDMVGGQ